MNDDQAAAVLSVPYQEASMDIWDKKYALYNNDGECLDGSVNGTFKRVAKAISLVETTKKAQSKWESEFLWAMENGAIPAGRITSNAGAQDFKPATSTINCTVSATIEDSMESILSANYRAGLTLRAGCGIGYEFSSVRPKNAMVAGAGASTSGPLSFMSIFDQTCKTISSAGGRRGAQMATFDIQHPDVLSFIKAKREDGKYRQFNFSLLITDDFIEAVKTDGDWPLVFPVTPVQMERKGLSVSDLYFRDWSITEGYVTNDVGEVGCEIFEVIKAKDLWAEVMTATYDFAEPGFILIDKVNEMNNNWFCENIRATNPCGEQPLPPNGSCLLGSINLTKMVLDPFTDKARFDFDRFAKVVGIFTRMLDNVVEINGLPLQEQREEIMRKRRHGMGYLGLGSTLAMLKVKYGSDESLAFTAKISETLAVEGFKAGVDLAKEKGAAPIMEEQFEITAKMLRQRPMLEDEFKLGDMVSGKVLFARYSHYIQQFNELDGGSDLIDDLAEFGSRFTHHSSIAPTGTISLSIANNASNGIEPSFAHHYARNVIREGRKTKEKIDVFSFETLAYRELINPEAMPGSKDVSNTIPDYFSSSDEVTPEQHVKVQAAAQKWIDSSISKTANIPTDFEFSKFENIYMYAYEQGLKGCTTFRFNPENFQGVLVTNDDLSKTTYNFKLDDGTTFTANGNEMIRYQGEETSAANLFDMLKEGSFG